jgi:hypothetical protein
MGLSWTETSEEEGEGGHRHWMPKRESHFPIPTEDQVVSRDNPNWDPESDKNEWIPNHFIPCILEGLGRAKVKPLNYSQVMSIQQGPLQTP